MARQKHNPYSGYDVDDWQWEFLRRNKRYQRAYRAVEWLRKRLDKNFPCSQQNGCFKGSGISYSFYRDYSGDHGWVWRYDEKWTADAGEFTDGWYLALPSPDASSQEYKAKILRMRKPRAVAELGEYSEDDDSHVDIRPPNPEQKLAILVDVRYDNARIISELKRLLKLHRPKLRNRLNLYKSYLEIWDRFQCGRTAEQIAEELYPQEYATEGGNVGGDKSPLSTKIYDHRDRANELIENAFPAKKRTPQIQK